MNRFSIYYLLNITPWELNGPHPALVGLVDRQRVQPCRALDLGCGTGANVLYLRQKGFDVVGVDLSHRAVARARDRLLAAGESAELLSADLHRLDRVLPAGSFDLTVDIGTMHTFRRRDQRGFAETVARMSRPSSHHFAFGFHPGARHHRGGHRLVKQPPGFDRNDLVRLFGPHGFDIVESEERTLNGSAVAGVYLLRRKSVEEESIIPDDQSES